MQRPRPAALLDRQMWQAGKAPQRVASVSLVRSLAREFPGSATTYCVPLERLRQPRLQDENSHKQKDRPKAVPYL